VGIFKDLFGLTRNARELQKSFPMPPLGETISAMNAQVEALNAQRTDSSRLLSEGIEATGTVIELGPAQPDANIYNQVIDLEVRPRIGAAYRVANEYLVPRAANLAVGDQLRVRVDPNDRAKIAVDWEAVDPGPPLGEIRPA
jgi:hypothetical protein